MIKIIHTADIHYPGGSGELAQRKREMAIASLETLAATTVREGADLVVIAGDLFDRPLYNNYEDGLPELQQRMRDLMDICPVVAVSGTPSHDAPGCYEVLAETRATHLFLPLQRGVPCFLSSTGRIEEEVWSKDKPVANGEAGLLILGLPEPQKGWFQANREALGVQEGDQKIVQGMRQLLLGLGGIRNNYPELPCIFVYHGRIAGSMGSEDQPLPPGGLEIYAEDLALVGADYYALGDIHLAQQIGDLPAYYPGSAYPVNWGEVDQKGFNLVEFDTIVDDDGGNPLHECIVVRQSFPHPPRKKIVLGPTDPIHSRDVTGYQVWVVSRGTKEEIAQVTFDTEALLSMGALPGSRVTKEVLPTETVRAGEISEATRLREKVKIWAENSDLPAPECRLKKADVLEEEARSEGAVEDGLWIRVNKLGLRGAKGLWARLELDEVWIDLDSYDPGVIAIIGDNGSGKTTLIENMHPYPTVFTRPCKKLQDHFRLKDSWRDLYFTDERTGTRYRSLMKIEGVDAVATGRNEYHLYWNTGDRWKLMTDGHGGLDEYKKKIKQLFGSVELYHRSAFISQKPTSDNPDLADTQPAQRKSLFRALGGLDYIEVYSKAAKERADSLEDELRFDRGQISSLEELVAELPAKREAVAGEKSELEDLKKRHGKVEAKGRELKVDYDAVAVELEEQKRLEEEKRGLHQRLRALETKKQSLEGVITGCQRALAGKDDAERTIAEYETLQAEEKDLSEQRAKIAEEGKRILQEYNDAARAVADQKRELEEAKREAQARTRTREMEKSVSVERIDEIEGRLAHPTVCPNCKHSWVDDQVALEEKRDEFQRSVWNLDKELGEFVRRIPQLDVQLEAIVEPDQPTPPTFDSSRLDQVQFDLVNLEIATAREDLRIATEAEVRITESRKAIADVDHDAETAQDRLDAILLDPDVKERYDQLAEDLKAVKDQYIEVDRELTRKEADVRHLEREISQLSAKAAELDKLTASIIDREKHMNDWRFLEQACGRDGIQALELDAMGPGVSAIANEILEAAYGSRFKIELRTTALAGRGSKVYQKEVFDIVVHDTERGEEQLLETLSGGEAVWIKRAIFEAFGIKRAQKTDQRFLTVFQDEADGALDPEARMRFFRMLEAAHRQSGRRHTIVITHAESAQQTIAHRILMSELTGPEEVPEEKAS